MLKVAVTGSTGRMGQMLIREVYHHPTCELRAALAREGNPLVGEDIGSAVGLHSIGIDISCESTSALDNTEVIIDFSTPEGSLSLLEHNQGIPTVIGVTGFTDTQLKHIEVLSKRIPIVLAPNTSLGAAILHRISKLIAESLGPDYDIEIFEMHHSKKVDSPSGTSHTLIKELSQVSGFHINNQIDRNGPREKGAIQITVSRGGGVIGDHSVTFAGEKELISINHRALDRTLFAQGAIRAAAWVKDKAPGLYTMEDVLSL